jgi:hypothetical protein
MNAMNDSQWLPESSQLLSSFSLHSCAQVQQHRDENRKMENWIPFSFQGERLCTKLFKISWQPKDSIENP